MCGTMYTIKKGDKAITTLKRNTRPHTNTILKIEPGNLFYWFSPITSFLCLLQSRITEKIQTRIRPVQKVRKSHKKSRFHGITSIEWCIPMIKLHKRLLKNKKKLHLGVCDVPPSVFRFWLENCRIKTKKKQLLLFWRRKKNIGKTGNCCNTTRNTSA